MLFNFYPSGSILAFIQLNCILDEEGFFSWASALFKVGGISAFISRGFYLNSKVMYILPTPIYMPRVHYLTFVNSPINIFLPPRSLSAPSYEVSSKL